MNTKEKFGVVLIFIGLILLMCAAIDAAIFNFSHIDMTELRLFIEHPRPTIICIIGFICGLIGISITRNK